MYVLRRLVNKCCACYSIININILDSFTVFGIVTYWSMSKELFKLKDHIRVWTFFYTCCLLCMQHNILKIKYCKFQKVCKNQMKSDLQFFQILSPINMYIQDANKGMDVWIFKIKMESVFARVYNHINILRQLYCI